MCVKLNALFDREM